MQPEVKDIAIYGAGGLGRETASTLSEFTFENEDGWNLIGFFDDAIEPGTMIGNHGKVLGGINSLNAWDKPINVAICVGYPQIRAKIIANITNSLVRFPNLINKDIHISDINSFKIGFGNLIQWGCHFTTNTSIGNFNLMNGEIGFGHDNTIGDFNVFMSGTHISGGVTIGNRNLFGSISYVMERLRVGSDVTLGPLSAMLTKPSDGNTYIGNPAKKFKF